MERGAWGIAAVLAWSCSAIADGDPGRNDRRFSGGHGIEYRWYSSFPNVVPRGYVYSPGYTAVWGYPLTTGAIISPGYYWPAPMPMSVMPGSPLSAPHDALPSQISPYEKFPGPKIDPAEKPVLLSSTSARLKSLKLQVNGDQYLRKQMWYHANVNYKQAVAAADDQAEAHLRYGISLAAMKRFDEALSQFKRAVFINPDLPRLNLTLETLFGPSSQVVRSSLLSAAADWLQADLGNADRIFVMGVLLHFNGDARAQELFSAALPISGHASYIAAFLPEGKVKPPQPAPQPGVKNGVQLPPAPVPIDAPPAPGLIDEPPTLPKTPTPNAKPAAPNNDGPVLLPPAPQ